MVIKLIYFEFIEEDIIEVFLLSNFSVLRQ
jgi:hypothetical protein